MFFWLWLIAWFDYKQHRIPNWLTLPIIVGTPFFWWGKGVPFLTSILPIWVLAYISYLKGWHKAGDAKVIMAYNILTLDVFKTIEFWLFANLLSFVYFIHLKTKNLNLKDIFIEQKAIIFYNYKPEKLTQYPKGVFFLFAFIVQYFSLNY